MKNEQDDDFIRYTEAFEKSVGSLRNDLEYMVEHSRVSDRFIERKNKVLSHIISYHNYMEALVLEYQKEIQFLNKVATSLEAICVIHGIVDFRRFLRWGKELLVLRANELQEENKFQLPAMFKGKLENLPKEEQEIIESILFREVNLQLKELLDKVKQRKNSFVYGIGT